MSLVKFLIFSISILTTTNYLINSHNLRLLEEKDWKGYINIKNNVSGFDESADIQITNNVNGKTEKNNSKNDSSSSESSASSHDTATSASSHDTATSASSHDTATSASSHDTATSESTVVDEDKKESEELKHNLLNSKEINIPTDNSFTNFLKVVNGLTIDASKITSLNIHFHYRVPINPDTKHVLSKLTHLKTLSLNEIKGELTTALINDIIGNHKLESIYLKNVYLPSNTFLDTLINSSSETLENLSIIRSELPEDFYKVFGSKSSSFVKLLEIKFAGQKLTDNSVKDAFNDKSTIKKYYLPKNDITDIGLLYLTNTVLGQFDKKVYPWVLVVPYNSIAMKDNNLYTQFGLIGEKKEKDSSFSIEIYENPLQMNKEKTEKLYKDYGILFNDFDNEGEYDDL